MQISRVEQGGAAVPAIKELLTTVADEIKRSWSSRGFGLLLAWTLAATTAIVALVLPDRYSARAQIYVNTDTLLRPLLKGLAIDTNPEQQVGLLQKTLLTDTNLSKVLLQLDDDLKVASRSDLAGAIEGLRSQIRIDGIGNQLFSISYEGPAPERARQVVQSLLTIFIESNLGQSRTDMQAARDFVDQQIAQYETQLREADQKLAQFRAEHVGVLGQDGFAARLEAARTAYEVASVELQAAREMRATLEQRLNRTEAFLQADTPPPQIVVGDQLIVSAIDRINTLRAQLQALRLRYTDDHPDVIAARDELAALVQQYSDQGATAVARAPKAATTAAVPATRGQYVTADASNGTAVKIASDASGGRKLPTATTPNPEYAELQVQLLKAKFTATEAEQKVARAKAALTSLQAEARVAPPVEAELADLTRGYEVMKKNYEALLGRRESARLSQAADTSVDVVQFRVVEPPVTPANPSGPNRNIFLLFGTMLALAGGGFGAFVRGTFQDAVISSRDLQSTFGLPVVATIGAPTKAAQPFYMTEWARLIASVVGIIFCMIAIAYLAPYLEPYRLKAFEVLSDVLR